jgi:hypothetical protein
LAKAHLRFAQVFIDLVMDKDTPGKKFLISERHRILTQKYPEM